MSFTEGLFRPEGTMKTGVRSEWQTAEVPDTGSEPAAFFRLLSLYYNIAVPVSFKNVCYAFKKRNSSESVSVNKGKAAFCHFWSLALNSNCNFYFTDQKKDVL